MKELTLSLTDEQFARFEAIAKSTRSKVERLIPAIALADLDGGGRDWAECGPHFRASVGFYMVDRNASDKPKGGRIEDYSPYPPSIRQKVAVGKAEVAP